MYEPPHFREDRLDILHDAMRAHPLATLVSHRAGRLTADHIPLVIHAEASAVGTLRGHIAKANPLWRQRQPATDVLAIFQGPQAYVTPSWYPSKKEHGKVVPTWNYVVVHAHGTLRFIEDAGWLLAHLDTLTTGQERDRPAPWHVTDAPDDFLAGQLKGIVGIEIEIADLQGKWKASQNRNAADRAGVREGLRREDRPDAAALADLIDIDAPS